MEIIRRPIYIAKSRETLVADFLGGKESPVKASYSHEDCTRWAIAHSLPINIVGSKTFWKRASTWGRSDFEREELPARAYYAAVGTGRNVERDKALFRAAFVKMLDVNEKNVVREAIVEVGLETDEIMERALSDEIKQTLVCFLEGFEHDCCPGVPTWVVNGERFWG